MPLIPTIVLKFKTDLLHKLCVVSQMDAVMAFVLRLQKQVIWRYAYFTAYGMLIRRGQSPS